MDGLLIYLGSTPAFSPPCFTILYYRFVIPLDWIHEFVKEQIRLRTLRALRGVRGSLANMWDSIQAWLLVCIIGVVCGCLAALIDVCSEYLSDLKTGYCARDFTLGQTFCCKSVNGRSTCRYRCILLLQPRSRSQAIDCPDWRSWSELWTPTQIHDPQWVDFLAYCLIGITFALVSAGLVYLNPNRHRGSKGQVKTTYYTAGSGIPEVKVILSGFVIRGFLGIKTLWVKSVGLVFSVASGIITGKEGPFVHVACCVGNIACRIFDKYEKNDGKRREILSASAAAGVAMAFGAPIGGVLFSLEQVSYYFPNKTMLRSYMCALIAAMTLKFINPFRTDKIVMFQVTYDREWHWFELGFFLALGVFGGVYGSIFCKLNYLWVRYRRTSWIKDHQIAEVLVYVTLTLVLSYPNIYTRMNSTDLVATLFAECKEGDSYSGLCVHQTSGYTTIVKLLAFAFFNKAILTIITFGLRVPHGIFVPSLVIGACLGRLMGTSVEYLYRLYPTSPFFDACGGAGTCITPGAYALVGGAAVLCGVTKMTLSLIVILFELTGSLTYILPIMLVVMVAKWVSDFISPEGVYEKMIRIAGHPFLNNQREYIHTKSTGELMQSDLDVIDANEENTVTTLRAKLSAMIYSGFADGGFPILNGDLLVGYISCSELDHALEKTKHLGPDTICYFGHSAADSSMEDVRGEGGAGGVGGGSGGHLLAPPTADFTVYVDLAPLSVSLRASVEMVTELFSKLGVRYLCVVEQGRFQGVIHKKRFLHYLQEVK
ncbi:chloride channel [Dimargaris cristalligena]|uniref:Chloride channel n=1 Tax=Dimargaris cristalligena TaxID=215637 RepID=A0A4P9ZTC7_9FUNG|nr:chloride channel [Dimargaris cristalligena]|eukprot:RKP35992.1 chloride channel [Dimargaris cristalligena]